MRAQRLNRYILPSLSSSGGQDAPAARRAHSFAEAVHFAARALLGLIRSFHNLMISFLFFFAERPKVAPLLLHLVKVKPFDYKGFNIYSQSIRGTI